jgi:predicted ATPase/class 3 adenylate cyclase
MRNPPSGTVTFLFTDVEGSTKRWEQHPQEMQRAMQRHDGILRAAIEQHGGYVFKTVGDGFCAAFPTPHLALAAAMQAQRALYGEDWDPVLDPRSPELRVRMALHTSVTEERDGDYFGPPVNRVARLLSAGYGGQVLLSHPTYDLVRDNLPSGASLRDMGEHRLKDLTRPEHIFHLVFPDLPTEFPPLRTLDNHPNNLPLQPTSLIGRENEVAAIVALLGREDSRLVTLTGPGGTGKTRLALQAAAEFVDRFADGAFLVNLAPITDHSLVISEIAKTLGVREGGGQPLIANLKEHLREKQQLLILDNFEQLVEAAPTVSDLLLAAPRLKVLVTSRARLQLRGEKEYSVPPLQLPNIKQLPTLEHLAQYEAVRLFTERAIDARSDFQVTNDNAPAVAEICVRLDGLPLAIELAAARIKILPPQAMLTRLQSRLKLLTGGARDLPARQQTLRRAIEWSYDLLDEGEKQLLRRLAVFAGGRTLEAVEAVCNEAGDLDILDGVSSLADKSLLRQEVGLGGEPRLVMLETIHEYALEKLQESGEAEELRRRHARYFLEFAQEADEQLARSRHMEWLDRVEEEHNNLRAALEWSQITASEEGSGIGLLLAGALWRFWEVRGYLTEGREWLARVLSSDAAASRAAARGGGEQRRFAQPARSKVLIGAARLALFQSDHPAARPFIEESLTILGELGDKANLSIALGNLGFMLMNQGDLVGAHAAYEESVVIRRELGDKLGMAGALTNVGLVAALRGDFARARSLEEESLSMLSALDSKEGKAYALRHLGFIAHSEGDYEQARAQLRASLALFWELGNKRVVAECLAGLAAISGAEGRPEQAAKLFGAAQALYVALGTTMWDSDRPLYERDLAAARARLGEEAWARAQQDGRAMSLEQAIEYALERTPER